MGRRETESTRLLHSQTLKFSLPLWRITLDIVFFLSVNDPYIVSTLPGGLLVFEVELCFGGVREVLEKQSILVHPQPPSSCSLFQIFSTISASHLPEPSYSILIFFRAFITCWLTLSISSPPSPAPPVLLSFSARHHTLITSSIIRIKCEGRPRSRCLNLPIMEPKGIWNWVWRLHQGHLLHPTG